MSFPAPLVGSLRSRNPVIHSSAFLAPGSVVIGDVHVGENSSIWYGAILRGDEELIRIGEWTNLQDGVIVHTTTGEGPTVIGSRVTIGHRAVLHGCQVGDGAMIGIGSIVLDGAVVEAGSMVAAGAVVTPRSVVRSGQLWSGCPAKPMRDLRPAEFEFLTRNPDHYKNQAQLHRTELAPSTAVDALPRFGRVTED